MFPLKSRVLAWPAAAMLAGLIAGLVPAAAQGAMCTSHDKMAEALAGKFGEQRKAIGLVSNAGLMELFVSSNGTWTVTLTSTEKIACIVAAGHSYDEAPAEKKLSGMMH
jgi:hypothetical protein